MSTKTKQRLSQLLFRRSNNASNASAPANSSSSSQTHHKPQVMGCGNNKNTYEEFAKEESTPSLSSYGEISEGDESRVLQPQKLVAFSDKHLLRARSSSPNKQRAPPDAKPVSILKNGIGHSSPQTKNNRGRRNALGKATLQRTKSNPIPQQNKPAIDANNKNAIECEASSPAAASNPLLDLSWNCPTLEKRKELILSYFKNYVLDPEGKQQQQQQQQNQSNTTDPIYEEINDNSRNQKLEDCNVGSNNNNNKPSPSSSKTDSLKPKLLPKKVRLNIPVQVESDQSYPPIYDKLRPTRSFNIYDTLRGKNKSSSDETATSSSSRGVITITPNNRRNGDSAESNSKSGANKLNNTITANNSGEGIILKDGLAGGGVGLAHFASEVAQHATSRRANRSNSFTPSSLSSLSSSSVNDGKSSHNNNLLSPSSEAAEPMDQIYSQLTKRGKKVGSVTSRLLKRHNNNHLLYNHEHGDNSDESITVYGATEHKPTKMDDGCLSGELREEANSKNKRTINVGGNYEECDDSYEYSSQEDESESHKVEKSCANLEPLPVRPLRKGRGNATPSTTAHNQSEPRSSPILNNIQQPKEKELPEKDLKALSSRNNQTGFINLADVFPPISVIDSTAPQPRAYPLSQFKDSSSYAANSGNSFTHTNKDIDRNNCRNHWQDISQKKEVIETSVKVKEEKDQFNISTETHLLSEGSSGTDDSLSSQQQNRRDNRNNSSIMDLQTDQETSLASSTEVIKEVDTEPLLVLWEDQKSVVVTQKSPQEDLLLLGDSSSETSTTSDLYLSDSVSSSGGSNCGGDEASIITIIRTISPTTPATVETSDETEIKMTAMNDSNEEMRNQFIRQESKHFYDDEDDGGFESFQVVGNEYDEDDGVGVEDGPFSPPSSSGSPDNMIGRPRTFAQNQQNVPQTELAQKASSVLDLINAEISDLHMRELELKKKNRVADGKEIIEDDIMGEAERSSQADSDDYTDSAVDIAESYSRTSVSSGNVTPNDGVRMERDVSPHSEKGQDEEIFEDVSGGSKMGIAMVTTEDDAVATKQPQQQSVKVRPIVEEEEVKSIALNITKETPIEREIRAVREREEEFRRSRGVSSSSSLVVDNSVASPPPTGEKISIEPPQKEEEVKVSVTSTVTAVNPSGNSGSKDIQYEMAAARLKREIEEGLKRERELYEEGRLKTLRSDEVKGDSQPGEAGEASPPPQGAAFTPFKTLVKIPKKPTVPKGDVDPLSVPFGGVPSSGVQSNGSPAGKTGFSFAPAPTATTMSLSIKEEPVQIQLSPQQTQSLPMNKITKPQFTSIEKMILKGSFSFNRSMSEDEKRSSQMEETARMGKVSRMPDPLQIVQRVESIEEIEEGGTSQSETDKPRRKYVTAQDKIQMELQEQVKREKELSQLRAKWKSTPDLSKMDEENGVEKEDIMDASEETDGADEYLPTKPSALRRQRQLSQSTQKIDEVTTSDVLKMNKPTVRRRQSALINQWEEMIKQQQEKNKN